jgi:hypothetical protein
MSQQYQDLLKNTFGYKPQNLQPVAPPSLVEGFSIPESKKYNTRDSVSRDTLTPEITGAVQAIVWGNGAPPPPKPPNAKMAEHGQAPAMKNQKGWGKI